MSVGIHTSNGFVKVAGVGLGANTMTGATATTAGIAGLAPAPSITDKDRFLKGDGTWAEVDLNGAINSAKEYTDERLTAIDATHVASMELDGSVLTLKNNEGTTISSVELPAGTTSSASEPTNPTEGQVWIE